MKNARFESFELVGNDFGFVGKVKARYADESGRLVYLVREVDSINHSSTTPPNYREFGEKQLHRVQAASSQ